MPIPAAAPVLRPLEEVDDVDVPETAPAVAVEEAEDELEETLLLPLAPADVAAEPELEAVADLWEELVAIAIVDVSRRARGREARSPFCASGWFAQASLMIWTKLPSTTLPCWLCRQAAHFGASAGNEPELIEQ